MKNVFYFFCLLYGVVGNFHSLQAQIVTIPDANFKAALIASGIDTNNDGDIQVTEAQAVNTLYIGSNSIADITGISAFVNLQYFDCYNNPLTSLDVSNNTALITLGCGNNQLTSLDVSNNTNLTDLYCHFNQLTSLDVSNNIALAHLDCYFNQLTSLDISNNIALTHLDCNNNLLASLDVSNNTALTHLYCHYNQFASLDVSNNIALTHLGCYFNQLTSLDVSNNAALSSLDCSANPLTSLDVSNNTALITLYCYSNQLTSLDVSNNTALSSLVCNSNQLTSLDVSNNTALTNLYCYSNPLTSLDVSNNTALTSLGCSDNQLTSLDVSNNTALTSLGCYSNPLTSLDVSNNTALITLECYYNQLTSLDISNNTTLTYLFCSANQLTSLDVSNNSVLSALACDYNPLISLILKNGSIENYIEFGNNPNLNYICADSMQLADIQSHIQAYGMTNVFVSTLCTYAPGGNYNTVSGKSFADLDMNGCAPNDSTAPFSFISVNNGTNSYYTCSNQTGDYLAYLDSGSYSLTPQVQNSSYFTGSTATVSFPNNNNNIQTQDLCITPNGVFPDVEISLIPLIPARPGFDANYQIQYKNIGTTTANGDITLDFQGNKMVFVNANISPTNQTTSQLTWNYNNLQPFEMRTMSVTMNILPPPTNNINDIIPFYANISLANDTDASNNTALLNQTIVGAYDPNDKTCLEGKLLHNDKIGDYLRYLIRFQNTGNYPAENVVVIDTLDAAKYDLASLQILETSHNAHIDLKNNVLQFYFENIQLADSFSNEPESHGFVVYKIKTKSTLPLNSVVKNKAEIYFDYNLPIITNLETTTFSSFLGIEYPAQKPNFQCYPNPAQNTLTIETPNKADFLIFNVMGEMLSEITVHNKENIDISFLPKGMYLLRAKNGGTGISFVKE